MSHLKRTAVHRMIKARQDNDRSGTDSGNSGKGEAGSTTGSSASEVTPSTSATVAASSASAAPPTTTPSSEPSPKSTAVKATTTSTPPPVHSTTTTATPTTSPTTSTSASVSSPTSTLTSVLTSASTSSSTSIKATPTTTLADVATNHDVSIPATSTFQSGSRASIGVAATVSADAIQSTTAQALSTGAIVGSVAGGLAGLAIFGLLIAFILRRWRKRSRDDDFDPSEFRRSAFVVDGPQPPTMAERGHNVAPSISSGPGMAGHGAYNSPAMVNTAAQADTAYAATRAGPNGLQERPQYTYGQDFRQNGNNRRDQAIDDDAMEAAHGGAYSSEPQQQGSYNHEAYGSYAAYENTTAAGYQDATREYQGQQGYDDPTQYYQQQHHEYNDYVVDPVHAPASKSHGKARSVQDDDVYGGI